MKNILVAIDFSDASDNAANYAASLANVFNANLILVNAYINPLAIDEMPATAFIETEKDLQQIKEDLLKEDIEILRKKYAIKINGVVMEGNAPHIIQDAAKEYQADIIVMGMKDKGMSNSIFGSATTTIMRKSSIPVLVIPENAEYKSIDTITLASDFDDETELSNYNLLNQLAEKNNSFIQILNVRKKGSDLSSSEVTGKLNAAFAFPKLNHKFYTIEDDDIDDGIEDFLEEHPSDVLAMVARKHNFFERVFGAIHTKEMSRETEIPLLVLQDK